MECKHNFSYVLGIRLMLYINVYLYREHVKAMSQARADEDLPAFFLHGLGCAKTTCFYSVVALYKEAGLFFLKIMIFAEICYK